MEITSKENARFRELMSLWTSKGIKRTGLALVCGEKLVLEMLRHQTDRVVEAVVTSDMKWERLGDQAHLLTPCVLSKTLFWELDQLGTKSPLLICRVSSIEPLAELSTYQQALAILPLQSPDNLGAAIRSASAFGVQHIALTQESAQPFLPKTIRSSAGTVFTARLLQTSSSWRSLSCPADRSFALDAHGEDLQSVSWPKAPIFLLGEEGQGAKDANSSFKAIRIPMEPHVESLNATVALSVVLQSWYASSKV